MKTAYVAFKNPATSQIENEGSSIRLRRPSTWNFDAAKMSSSQDPRIMQAALKVNF